MTKTDAQMSTETLSEDQKAVAEYFASATYNGLGSSPKPLPPLQRRPVWPDRVLSPATSFWVGLCGLSGLLLVCATVSPIMAGGVRGGLDPEIHYLAFSILDQLAMYPTLIALTFAIVTPVFWYGSIIARFSLAALMIVPGYLTFLFTAMQVLHVEDDFWLTFTAAILAMFLAIAAVPVLVQMSSHWTLSHSRPTDKSYNPTGTRTIMELTVVTALTCAVLMSLNTSEFAETILLYAALGALSSAMVISMLVAFLRPERRNLYAAALSVLFAFGTSFVYSGMHAFEAFGWSELPSVIALIIIASVLGTVAYICFVWVFIWWLRNCGWACISREDEKEVREAEARGPWNHWFSPPGG